MPFKRQTVSPRKLATIACKKAPTAMFSFAFGYLQSSICNAIHPFVNVYPQMEMLFNLYLRDTYANRSSCYLEFDRKVQARQRRRA